MPGCFRVSQAGGDYCLATLKGFGFRLRFKVSTVTASNEPMQKIAYDKGCKVGNGWVKYRFAAAVLVFSLSVTVGSNPAALIQV